VSKGTAIENPEPANFSRLVSTEGYCESAYKTDGTGGLGGKCEDIDDDIVPLLGSTDPTCDTPDEKPVGLCIDIAGDFYNSCCVPKEGGYCKRIEELGGSCNGPGAGNVPAIPLQYGDYTLLEQLPGTNSSSGDLPSYLQNIYRVGLIMVVLGAVFMIAVGGFTYMASAGNTAAIKKGKGMITDALLGLVIALFAWFILNVINPDLVNLKIDPLDPLSFDANVVLNEDSGTPVSSSAGGSSGGGGTAIKCPSALVELPSKYSLKGGSTKICPELLAQLDRISGVSGWRVTRLTGGGAQSTCHKAGTDKEGSCVDIAFNPNPGFNNPKWDNLCRAVKGLSGLAVINEASNTEGCVAALGSFKKTKNQTGAHLHIIYTGK
jgi:hypothetical protein